MKRRRKQNPGGLTLVLVGGAVLVAAVFGVVLLEKKASAATGAAANQIPKGTALQIPGSAQQFVTNQNPPLNMSPADAAIAFLVGDCIMAVQGAAGFFLGDFPQGENILLKVATASGGGSSLKATPVDPRLPEALKRDVVNVPVACISQAGEC